MYLWWLIIFRAMIGTKCYCFTELLERVSEDNVEYRREIIHVIEQSYKDPESVNRLIHSKAFRVRNSLLLNEVSGMEYGIIVAASLYRPT